MSNAPIDHQTKQITQSVVATFEYIGPEQAEDILENHNPHNRKILWDYAESIAHDIALGAYIPTHQGLLFDTNEDLLDGQHRLAAVIKAKTGIWVQVMRDFPVHVTVQGKRIRSFEFIDAGRVRTNSMVLGLKQRLGESSLSGKKEAITATVRALANWVCQTSKWVTLSHGQNTLLLREVEASLEWACGKQLKPWSIKPQAGTLAPIVFYHTIDPVMAEKFVNRLCRRAGRRPDDATNKLEKYIESHRGNKGQTTLMSNITANTIRCIEEGLNLKAVYGATVAREAALWLIARNQKLADRIRKIMYNTEIFGREVPSAKVGIWATPEKN